VSRVVGVPAARVADAPRRLVHALSVDVEDWNNAVVLWIGGRVVPPTAAVVRNTERMIELIEGHGLRATWFVLGEVAATFPGLVRRLVKGGHEIGVHGYHHHRIHDLGRDAFRESIRRAKAVVEDAAGGQVKGYRAVAMSLTRATWWAYEVLIEQGFEYSSSVMPSRVARHGFPEAEVGVHSVRLAGGHLLEVPLTVVSIAGVRIPAAGGGYLRHLPGWFSRWSLKRLERERRPAVVYLHPYELDCEAELRETTVGLDAHVRRRIEKLVPSQIRGRQHTITKLRALFGRFRFAPISTVFAEQLTASAPAARGETPEPAGVPCR